MRSFTEAAGARRAGLLVGLVLCAAGLTVLWSRQANGFKQVPAAETLLFTASQRQGGALDWLRSEQDFANAQIASYSEADQKTIVVMATIVAAILGVSFSKGLGLESERLPYILFLSSGLVSIAVLQSVVYSSLILIFMERKIKLNSRMAEILYLQKNFVHEKYSIFEPTNRLAYRIGVMIYFVFKSLAGLGLACAGWLFSDGQRNVLFILAFGAAIMLAISCFGLTILHLLELFKFKSEVLSREVG